MIPKKIHFTWFSNDPYPDKIKECMASWSIYMPEYELVHWDMKRIENIDNVFLREAIKAKKWAFASDFIRLYALYHEGGIYLDTDVVVFKSFNDLLGNKCFIGRENYLNIVSGITEYYLTSHCMGAVKSHPFIKECLDYYEGRHFITSDNEKLPQVLRFDMTIQPFIQSEIAKQYGYSPYPSTKGMQSLKNEVSVYPTNYLDPLKQKKESYCRHLAAGSWRPPRFSPSLRYRILRRLGKIIEAILSPLGFYIIKKT